MSIQHISIEALADVVGGAAKKPPGFADAIANRAYNLSDHPLRGPATQPQSVDQLVAAGTDRNNIVCLDLQGQKCFREY